MLFSNRSMPRVSASVRVRSPSQRRFGRDTVVQYCYSRVHVARGGIGIQVKRRARSEPKVVQTSRLPRKGREVAMQSPYIIGEHLLPVRLMLLYTCEVRGCEHLTSLSGEGFVAPEPRFPSSAYNPCSSPIWNIYLPLPFSSLRHPTQKAVCHYHDALNRRYHFGRGSEARHELCPGILADCAFVSLS
jgi:hypothetical protein